MAYLFILQQVLQLRVGLDALQLVGDNLPYLRLDAVVVLLNHLLHAVVGWQKSIESLLYDYIILIIKK